jgi:uncharacterized protein YecT (DUF1311 family)
MRALQSDTQGGSRMPELGPYGSVRGARGNSRLPRSKTRSSSRTSCATKCTFVRARLHYRQATRYFRATRAGATRVSDILTAISHTPLPTILVLAGIGFWILAVAGSLAGKITVQPGMQKTAGAVGTTFLVLGVILLFYAPDHTANQSGPEATLKPQQPTAPATELTKDTQATTSATAQKVGPIPGEIKPAPKPDQPHAVPSPGVNCTGTGTPDEIEICRSAPLKELDWQLFYLYRDLLNRLDKSQQTKLAHEESAWVKQRGECKSDENCITAQYKLRISQLQSLR